MAVCSSGVPVTEVYLVWPALIASIAAALMWPGVSKSGSPTVRSMIGMPSARSSRTRAAAATLAEDLMRVTLDAGRYSDICLLQNRETQDSGVESPISRLGTAGRRG